MQGQDEEDIERHLNVVKNKLTGWHGSVHCNLDIKQRGTQHETNIRRREYKQHIVTVSYILTHLSLQLIDYGGYA